MKKPDTTPADPEWQKFLAWPFSTRTRNLFEKAKIRSLAHLTSFSPFELLRYRDVGHKTIAEIRHALASVGRALVADTPQATLAPDDLAALQQEQVELEARLREIKQRILNLKSAAKNKPTLAQTVLAHWLTTRDCAATAKELSLTAGKVREVVLNSYDRKLRKRQLDDLEIFYAWEANPDVATICAKYDIPDFVLNRLVGKLTKILGRPHRGGL